MQGDGGTKMSKKLGIGYVVEESSGQSIIGMSSGSAEAYQATHPQHKRSWKHWCTCKMLQASDRDSMLQQIGKLVMMIGPDTITSGVQKQCM